VHTLIVYKDIAILFSQFEDSGLVYIVKTWYAY